MQSHVSLGPGKFHVVVLVIISLVTIFNEGPRIDRRGLEWWA